VYYGNHEGAKETAATLIRDVGFDPVDVGPYELPGTWSRFRSSSGSSRTASNDSERKICHGNSAARVPIPTEAAFLASALEAS
jgi:hypothetical protein